MTNPYHKENGIYNPNTMHMLICEDCYKEKVSERNWHLEHNEKMTDQDRMRALDTIRQLRKLSLRAKT